MGRTSPSSVVRLDLVTEEDEFRHISWGTCFAEGIARSNQSPASLMGVKRVVD